MTFQGNLIYTTAPRPPHNKKNWEILHCNVTVQVTVTVSDEKCVLAGLQRAREKFEQIKGEGYITVYKFLIFLFRETKRNIKWSSL